MCTTLKTILKKHTEENIIIAIILGWYNVLSSISQASITWPYNFYKLKKKQTYWLSAKYIKVKQIIKDFLKLLNEMKQIKVFYKLYTAIQIYIYLQGIKITFALRKPNSPKN